MAGQMSQSILGFWSRDLAPGILGRVTSALQLWRNKQQAHPSAFINASKTILVSIRRAVRARHFPLCVPVIGLLADRYHPSLLCAALGHVSKRRASFFPFCKETVSLMAFKTGSTTIKVKSENARCRHLFPFRSATARITLSHIHVCVRTQTDARGESDTLTFRHSLLCLMEFSNVMGLYYKEN